MKRLQFCLVVFAVLALTFSAFAQVQNGQFTGTVTDPTGAAIANAKITVINTAIDLSLFATTNSSGNYTVKELPLGTYKMTVEASGFKTVVQHRCRASTPAPSRTSTSSCKSARLRKSSKSPAQRPT